MCGFIGVIRNDPEQMTEEKLQTFRRQNDYITHRGPDEEGFYHDEYISFGFRRLSIIDIDSGQQPLSYEDQRYWMVFNGEIYNYIELRENLVTKGFTFRTESDTEVIAALFHDKREKAFNELRGMFAILIWDKQEQQLYGARDPFGIKPLFFVVEEEGTYFASEKKSLTMVKDSEQVDAEALNHYLSFQYVPEPWTMTENIQKVPAGHYFTQRPGQEINLERYWHATFEPILMDKRQWIGRIQDVMYDSVAKHMRSDVGVGSFLSGGIDSSLIVAMAKEYHPGIKTFSVGFEREGYSEVDVAKETADKLGVENISYIISPEEYVAKLPKIMYHMDDPLADPACVPLYFVAREARKHITVVLSGEGADELFGGYNIYREPESLKVFQSIPDPAKHLLGRVADILPEGVKGKSFLERGTTPLRDRYIGNAKMFEEVEKEKLLCNHLNLPYQKVTELLFDTAKNYDLVNQMQYVDIHTWLRGDILLKADKMTMANSLELRVPFLDKEVFDVAKSIPVDLKIANSTTKSILREASRGIVPDHVLDRKKLGFPVPIRHWLKNELYDWAKMLILESETDEYLHKDYVLHLLEAHCQEKGDYSRKIWTVLMFMLWHQIFVERRHPIEDLINEDKPESKLTFV
ncbi:asparagine synthetase [glutamine-hydrolyzing] 1 [Thalassobacillus devorans]|uniref:asparagine synthase (glutamine-hydrolyzing) n=1 Tax=Thalassobacillus devorans TaxID=279813 RepID=A0ABQ1NRU6_9BACI|nr:asparagine synthase (glutamine-hydrolyzing) [Thalassobacillus devorans]NIK29114.1 asparagine synthase (glutamine-hydrolysing) [Thalassobacillus devorans]GGC81063.1 asparagine synthetase [glutamine-hydrolyzing] 1 [Thalassobacillus devorans]